MQNVIIRAMAPFDCRVTTSQAGVARRLSGRRARRRSRPSRRAEDGQRGARPFMAVSVRRPRPGVRAAVRRSGSSRRHASRTDFQQEPGGRLREEQDEVVGRVVLARDVDQRDRRAEAAGEGHLGQGDGQAALAQVVAAPDQSVADRQVDGPERSAARARDRPGDTCPRLSARAPPRASRPARRGSCPGRQRTFPASLKSIVTHLRTSGTWPDGADEERRRDGQALSRRACIRCSGCPCPR